MKIFFVTREPYPYGAAMTNRLYCYAKGIIGNGYDCEIVICKPTENYNNVRNQECNGVYNGTSFHYSTKSTIRSKNFITRRINDILGYTKTFFYLISKTKEADIVIETSKSKLWYFFLFIARLVCSFKLVYELNEYPLIFEGETESVKKSRQKLEKYAFSRLNGIIAISETLKEYAHSVTKAKVIKVPIIVDSEIVNSIKTDIAPLNVPYIFHSGTLTEQKDGVCGMLEAFGIAKSRLPKNTKFILTGNIAKSPDKKAIEDIINKYEIGESIEFTGYLDTETLRRYQKYCSLAIINKYPTTQNKYCFATKTSEYLVFARPIIITNVGEAMNFFKNNDNAYIVEPNIPSLIAEKIIEIFNNPEMASIIGERGKLLTMNDFNNIVQGKRMIEFFKTL